MDNMTIEEKLKYYILSRYNSLREFTGKANIPYTTFVSILDRGIENSSIANVMKICKALNLSVDALANGEIKPRLERVSDPVVDLKDVVNDVKDRITHSGHIVIDGNIIDIETAEAMVDAIDISYEMIKRKQITRGEITKTITQSNKN